MRKLNYGPITVSFEENLGYKHTYFKFRCFIECMPWHGKLLFKFHISSLWVKYKFCFGFSVPIGNIKCQSIQTCFIKKMWSSIIYLNSNSLWHIHFHIAIHQHRHNITPFHVTSHHLSSALLPHSIIPPHPPAAAAATTTTTTNTTTLLLLLPLLWLLLLLLLMLLLLPLNGLWPLACYSLRLLLTLWNLTSVVIMGLCFSLVIKAVLTATCSSAVLCHALIVNVAQIFSWVQQWRGDTSYERNKVKLEVLIHTGRD